MQLALTVLGKSRTAYIEQLLMAINQCKCAVLEIRATDLSGMTAGYLLVEGNWNHIAKLENVFENLEKQLKIQIYKSRQDKKGENPAGLPYMIEAMTIDQSDIMLNLIAFLSTHNINIIEIKSSRYLDSYTQMPILSTKLIVIIPSDQRLLQLREEFLDFCDNLNLDAILEPIKR